MEHNTQYEVVLRSAARIRLASTEWSICGILVGNDGECCTLSCPQLAFRCSVFCWGYAPRDYPAAQSKQSSNRLPDTTADIELSPEPAPESAPYPYPTEYFVGRISGKSPCPHSSVRRSGNPVIIPLSLQSNPKQSSPIRTLSPRTKL